MSHHKSKKQKELQRQVRLHGKAYHPPVLAEPRLYICKSYDSAICGPCPHGEKHLVSPVSNACGGHCEYRDITTHCIKVRKSKMEV